MKSNNHLFLVDGSGYIFRAYYALPPLYRKSDGLPTGAVNGFCNMLYKLIEDTNKSIGPTHLAVIFDSARKLLGMKFTKITRQIEAIHQKI